MWSDRAPLEPTTLALGEPTPDAEALVVAQGVLQALRADLAAVADLLGLAGRAALLGEEGLGVGLGAECPGRELMLNTSIGVLLDLVYLNSFDLPGATVDLL